MFFDETAKTRFFGKCVPVELRPQLTTLILKYVRAKENNPMRVAELIYQDCKNRIHEGEKFAAIANIIVNNLRDTAECINYYIKWEQFTPEEKRKIKYSRFQESEGVVQSGV